MSDIQVKTCCKCKHDKPLEAFARDKNNADGRTYDCKDCRSKKFKQWCADNPEKAKAARDKCWARRKDFYQRPEQKLRFRKRFIEKKYGIPYEEYEKMVDLQRNLCYVCDRPEPDKRNAHLAIDHCHTTGKVRKLLCSRCNKIVGGLEENADLAEKIKQYIINVCNPSNPSSTTTTINKDTTACIRKEHRRSIPI